MYLLCSLVFCLAQQPQSEAGRYFARLMLWIGQRSDEMYLFHLIILGLIKLLYLPKATLPSEKWILLPIYCIAVFILSWAIEKYDSTPSNLMIRSRCINTQKSSLKPPKTEH